MQTGQIANAVEEVSRARETELRMPMNSGTETLWSDHAWIWEQNVISPADQVQLKLWSEQIENWEESIGQWLKYYEVRAADNSKILSRVENFLPFHKELNEFILSSTFLTPRVAHLFGDEKPVLFKDKLNIKPPGGAPYEVHQDSPAYRGFGVTSFITAMIPVDDTNESNGCLEVAVGRRSRNELPLDCSGRILPSELADNKFVALPAKSGDLLLFDGLVPHRSGFNHTSTARRAIFLTFSRASEGDHRNMYFLQKRTQFPPEIERVPGINYKDRGRQFNLGNPFI